MISFSVCLRAPRARALHVPEFDLERRRSGQKPRLRPLHGVLRRRGEEEKGLGVFDSLILLVSI